MTHREISWPCFKQVCDHARHLDLLMEHIGVHPIEAIRVDKGLAYYQAKSTCIACNSYRDCHDWLKTSEPFAHPPEFCRNLDFFATTGNKGHSGLHKRQ